MPAPFTYDKMGQTDIPLIQSVGRASYVPYYQHIWYPGGVDWYMNHCFNAESLSAELSDPNVEYLIPRDTKGAIAGLLKLLLHQPTPDGTIKNGLYLEKIYLLPDFFGQGVGQQLMSDVFIKAKALGRQAVWLMVLKKGPVRAYERAGFRIVEEVSWEYAMLREPERAGWVMVRELGSFFFGGGNT